MTRLDDALGIAAERQHLRSPVRQRWGRASPLNDFKPRSGERLRRGSSGLNGIGVKNVAAPRLVFLFEIDRSQR